jgi:hypothetical protein
VKVDEPAVTRKGDNQYAAESEDPLPADGEPFSLAEKVKERYERHKPKIYAAAVTLGLGLVVAVHYLERQDAEGRAAEDAVGSEPVSHLVVADKPGRSATYPAREPFTRKLPAGQQASITARESYRERESSDLPPGLTWVTR